MKGVQINIELTERWNTKRASEVSVVLIGAGNRGHDVYGSYALRHPNKLRFVAVAEPHEARRARFAQAHNIPLKRQFHSWEDMLVLDKMADAAIVCTLDRMHAEPAVAALEAGYAVLLEKPMATTVADCVRLVIAAERSGRLLQICHVLRYTPFFSALHDIIASGRLGKVITVEHRENVVYWHMAHSFVRGSWRDSRIASPMILAKCCHDLDILFWNMGPVRRLNSFGSLAHYRADNAPPEAPKRCSDGCPHELKCPWSAPRLYLDLVPIMHEAQHSCSPPIERLFAFLYLKHPSLYNLVRRLAPHLDKIFDYRDWPMSVISEDTSMDARCRALKTGPYGRCVYHCDNDVVDHQTVNMEFESGATGVLFMHGHSYREGRTIRYDGTRATLIGHFYNRDSEIQIHDHLSGKTEIIYPESSVSGVSGHGGGDDGLMHAFVRAVRRPETALTTAEESLESHLMAFAAEQARIAGTVIDMKSYRQAVKTTV